MNTIRVVGIDIAKSVFQVCVWMVDGSVAWNRKISRQKLLDTLCQFEPGTLIAMEACSTSHFPQCYGIQRKAYPTHKKCNIGQSSPLFFHA